MSTSKPVIGIVLDIGGTDTRSILLEEGIPYDAKNVIEHASKLIEIKYAIEPKTNTEAPKDLEVIISKDSKTLRARLARIVRGKLVDDYRGVEKQLNFQTMKIADDIYLYNIISATASALMAKDYSKSEQQEVIVFATIPAREFKEIKDIAKLKKQIAGTWFIEFPLLNMASVKFRIKAENIGFMSEANASLKNLDIKDKELVVSVNVGETTTDIVVLENGRLVQGSADSFSQAGSNYRALLKEAIKTHNGEVRSDKDIYKILRDIKTSEEVAEKYGVAIGVAKNSFADILLGQYSEVLLNSGYSLDSPDLVAFSGRIFEVDFNVIDFSSLLEDRFNCPVTVVPNPQYAELSGLAKVAYSKLTSINENR